MQPWAQRLASGQGRGTNFQPWAKLYLSDFLPALLPLCRNLWIQAKELVRSMKESQVRTHWTLCARCKAVRPNTSGSRDSAAIVP